MKWIGVTYVYVYKLVHHARKNRKSEFSSFLIPHSHYTERDVDFQKLNGNFQDRTYTEMNIIMHVG